MRWMLPADILRGVPVLAAVTLGLLLWLGERTGHRRAIWTFKPATSALFLLVAFLRDPQTPFDWLVVAALVLSAVGDVALIPSARRWFLAGLVAFLLAHVAYALALWSRPEPWAFRPLALAAIAGASLATFAWLRPHLGAMLRPVVAYMAVITLMLAAAWSLGPPGWTAASAQLALAATLFYVSDLTVARVRFVPGTGFADRAIGLPLYYAAQFLFAFSVAM
jgi:uncharacterized membrane protein YhhN